MITIVRLKNGDPNKVIYTKGQYSLLNYMARIQKYSFFRQIALINLTKALRQAPYDSSIGDVKGILSKKDVIIGGGNTIADINLKNKKIYSSSIFNQGYNPKYHNYMIEAIDFKDGYVYDKGWTNNTGVKIHDAIQNSKADDILLTDINADGSFLTYNQEVLEHLEPLLKTKSIRLAGGFKDLKVISALSKKGFKIHVGSALFPELNSDYSMNELMLENLNFDKYEDKLIPTILQDGETKRILMQGFTSKESALLSLQTKKPVFYSRSRQKLWHREEWDINLIKADCDYDSILYIVKPNATKHICHEGHNSCFK